MSDKPIELQLAEILDEYQDELKDVIKDDFKTIGKETATDLKNTSKSMFKTGKGRKHYWSGWAYKVRGTGLNLIVTIYNRTAPGLTHLLENGHQVYVGRKNTGKRAEPHPHIEPAQQKATEELLRKLENDI